MNKRKKISVNLAAALFAAVISMSAALPARAASSTVADTPNNTVSAVPMVSGGVGDAEMDQVKQIQNQYDLKLLFTEANGMYLADVPVQIHDNQGRLVVNTLAQGPVLLVALPPGTYHVTATEAGEMQEQKVSVTPQSHREYQFRFSTRDTETSELP